MSAIPETDAIKLTERGASGLLLDYKNLAERLECQRDELAEALRRVTLALPVLRDVLRAARLAGADVAEDMLNELRALLARIEEEKR